METFYIFMTRYIFGYLVTFIMGITAHLASYIKYCIDNTEDVDDDDDQLCKSLLERIIFYSLFAFGSWVSFVIFIVVSTTILYERDDNNQE